MLYSCAKYGMAVDEFEINGVVTNRTNEPIPNIRIIEKQSRDTLYTNSGGKFSLRSWEGEYITLKFDDIDGEENGGEFIPREIDIKFTDKDIVKKGNNNKKPDQYLKTIVVVLRGVDEELSIEYGPPFATFKQ